MFIGHMAVGLAAKRITPTVSLGVLLLAAQWADTLWPVMLAFGMEHVRIVPENSALTQLDFLSYPYSHSLVALIGWGLLLGVAYRSVFGGRRTVWVISGLVVSHWVLDYITHLPDMPIYPGGPKVGLGLWRSTLWTVVIETAMYAAGLWIYMTTTRARDRIGRWGFVSLAAFMMLIYVASLTSGPPPSVQAIAIAGILGAALLVVWAWWADRHRTAA